MHVRSTFRRAEHHGGCLQAGSWPGAPAVGRFGFYTFGTRSRTAVPLS